MNFTIEELIKKSQNSSFNKNPYCVTLGFNRFVSGLSQHTNSELSDSAFDIIGGKQKKAENDIDLIEYLKYMTPEFQRSNDKWSKKMQTKFIENILQGAKTELLLFRFDEQEDAKIIDGLQRTTAIIDFFSGKIKPFGYCYEELKGSLNKFSTNVQIKIYTFKNWEEVGRFYIDMNENITHSKADIQKAKNWFLNEKNIVL